MRRTLPQCCIALSVHTVAGYFVSKSNICRTVTKLVRIRRELCGRREYKRRNNLLGDLEVVARLLFLDSYVVPTNKRM